MVTLIVFAETGALLLLELPIDGAGMVSRDKSVSLVVLIECLVAPLEPSVKLVAPVESIT